MQEQPLTLVGDPGPASDLAAHAIATSPLPDGGEAGALPSEADPDPAPERERPDAALGADLDPIDIGGGGEPVGNDNIRTGRVRGVMGVVHGQRGQGQGG